MPTVNVKSKATDAVSAVATGETTSSGSLGVAIGVSINTADDETESWLGGTSALAAGTVNVTAEGDADNAKDGVFDPAATVVAAAADTIDLGLVAAAKFATADEVSYDNGGGTSIGGLTSDGGTTKYYVIRAGEGKIKLAASKDDAKAGTAVDLTSVGAGTGHKIDSSDNAKDATFDPAATMVDTTADTIDIGFEAAARLAGGEEVTYDNGGGTSIGGLTSDGGTTKYYVIHAGEGKIKLATSAENAAAGTAVDLTSAGGRRLALLHGVYTQTRLQLV